MEMGRTYSKNEGQQMDQMLHRVAVNEREEIKGMVPIIELTTSNIPNLNSFKINNLGTLKSLHTMFLKCATHDSCKCSCAT